MATTQSNIGPKKKPKALRYWEVDLEKKEKPRKKVGKTGPLKRKPNKRLNGGKKIKLNKPGRNHLRAKKTDCSTPTFGATCDEATSNISNGSQAIDNTVVVNLTEDEITSKCDETSSIKVEEDSEDEFGLDGKKKKPAWIDDDDKGTFEEVVSQSQKQIKVGINGTKNYKKIAEEKYRSVMGVPRWVTKKPEEENHLLKSSGEVLKKSSFLQPKKLEWVKVNDLNSNTYGEGSEIKCVEFHSRSTVGLVAGVSGQASLFAVDGIENSKLQSILFKKYPISCGAFLRGGEEFLVGSNFYKYFYSHNLMSGQTEQVNNAQLCDINHTKMFRVSSDEKHIAVGGNFGNIYLMTSNSKEFIGSLKMNGNVNCLDFHDNYLYSFGDEGEVYVWDMKSRDCVYKFMDEGCISGTAIATSPNGQYLATGASSGVINIYDLKKVNYGQSVQPLKTIYNIVTPVTTLKFNSSSDILCAASSYKENAIKLIHCSSMTVFDNFPSLQVKFNRIQCVDFSPNSGYFSIGNNRNAAQLFRLKFYGNY